MGAMPNGMHEPSPSWYDAHVPYYNWITGRFEFLLWATDDLVALLGYVREIGGIERRYNALTNGAGVYVVPIRKDCVTDWLQAVNVWRGACSFLDQRCGNAVFLDDGVWGAALAALDLPSVMVSPHQPY